MKTIKGFLIVMLQLASFITYAQINDAVLNDPVPAQQVTSNTLKKVATTTIVDIVILAVDKVALEEVI